MTASSASRPPPGAASSSRSRSNMWSADIRQFGASAHHLHRSQSDLGPRLRPRAVHRADPAEGALVRPVHQPDRPRSGADGTDGAQRLLGPADRLRDHLDREPRATSARSSTIPTLYATLIADLHRLGITIQGCFVFGNDHDTEDVRATANFVIETRHRPAAFRDLSRLSAARRCIIRLEREGPHPHPQLGAVRRPARGVSAQDDDAEALQKGHERAWKRAYSWRAILSRLRHARMQLPLSLAANLGYRFYAHHLHTHYTCDWPQVGTEAA